MKNCLKIYTPSFFHTEVCIIKYNYFNNGRWGILVSNYILKDNICNMYVILSLTVLNIL